MLPCIVSLTENHMVYDPKKHHRRSIRLRDYDYSWPGWYFVAMCTQDRICSLAEVRDGRVILTETGRIIERWWKWLEGHFPWVELDEYVIMPNHLHGILIINDQEHRLGGLRVNPKPIGRLIGAFKTTSTKEINQSRKTPGSVFWQRDFYEHVVRNEADLSRIRWYIANNPLKWSLDRKNPETYA